MKDLNAKLKEKYGADLSLVSPLTPQVARAPSDLQASAPGVPASQTMDRGMMVLRKGELVDFYSFHDPKRVDIEGHVDRLFDKYSLSAIKTALITKYGTAPPEW